MLNKALSLPVRRFLACIAIIVFVIAYVIVITAIAEHLPKNQFITMVFYALAGILWGLPVLPIISWSEGYRKKPRK